MIELISISMKGMSVLNKSFFEDLSDNFSLELSDSQKRAVSHFNGPALVLAVPGAGKTTVLISRVANLIETQGIPASKILSITFSKASAKDMASRFQATFGRNLGISPKFSTIHSFAFFVIRDFSSKTSKTYKLIEESGPSSKSYILRNIYRELNNFFLSDDKLDELINSIGYVKNMMISPTDLKATGIRRFTDVYNAYEQYKAKNNLIDFDDMLSLSYDILSKNKDLLESYRSRYEYIQVDEGQDTSNIQHKIIELLSEPKNNLFIVADDDQSIYGFRGANPDYLLNFKEVYPDAKIFYMSKNYRSTIDIVDLSNKLIKKNKARYDKDLIPNSSINIPINIVKFKHQEEQYSYIFDLLDSNELDDTAILFRSNVSSIPLLDILERNKTAFRLKDSKLNFFNHWLLKDILCFLRLSIDPSDFSSFEKIFYKMKGYISKKGVLFVEKNLNSELSIFSVLSSYGELKPFQVESMRKLNIDFKKLSKKRPLSAIEFISNDLNYLDYLKQKSDYMGYGMESNLSILNYIKSLASRCGSILDFIDRIEELKSFLMENKSEEGVFISTMHSAKGLEFKNVFILDLVNGDFPSSNTLDSMKEGSLSLIEEERRLFYVGMTRAKENLHLLSYRYRDDSRVPPSIFLREVEGFLSEDLDDELKVNTLIRHKKFGKGIILDSNENSILVEFYSFGKKQLLKSTCLEENLIELLKD